MVAWEGNEPNQADIFSLDEVRKLFQKFTMPF